jgi:hypothetical protein
VNNILLQIIWVAAHHGLRLESRQRIAAGGSRNANASIRWGWVCKLTAVLGHPPAPGGPL